MKNTTKKRLFFLIGFMLIIAVAYTLQMMYAKKELPSVSDKTQLQDKTTEAQANDFDTTTAIAKALSSPQGKIIRPQTKAEVASLYDGITMITVPHLFIDTLPADWTIQTTADKTLFMKIITALILRTNEQILNERTALRLLQEKYMKEIPWNQNETAFFDYLVKKYDAVLKKNTAGKLAELIDKVNIIPPSLAVAQAIMFTNWGTKNQSAPYGEYGWINETAYEPLQFDSLIQATDSFALQLNSRSQLLQFREIRRRLIPYERTRELGVDLLDNMAQFMSFDEHYVKKLANAYNQGLIKELDHACFEGTCQLIDNTITFE